MHGDLAGAVGLYDRVLAIRERLVEEGRPELAKNLAMTYQNKAFALRELGDFDGAVGLYDRALAIYERLVHQEGRGELANELAATYLNKADVLPKLRDLAGAVGLYDRALAIYERLVEEGRRELAGMLARTYQNKAIALAALGDLAGAVGCFDRALAIRERLVERGAAGAGEGLGPDLPEQGAYVGGARGPRGGGRMLRPGAGDCRAAGRAGWAAGAAWRFSLGSSGQGRCFVVSWGAWGGLCPGTPGG